jgi:hypothetical protein
MPSLIIRAATGTAGSVRPKRASAGWHGASWTCSPYPHGNQQRIMTLTASEFLRRFCQHVLPRGFVRIRHFGYLASAHRTALLALARQ